MAGVSYAKDNRRLSFTKLTELCRKLWFAGVVVIPQQNIQCLCQLMRRVPRVIPSYTSVGCAEHWNPTLRTGCNETRAEDVSARDSANFCEWFFLDRDAFHSKNKEQDTQLAYTQSGRTF